ncbi:replication-relaxation family protein [Frankia sp. AgPm24]|uniref:replication-relaxation family protein n=1 Tax=Frankia sp. AgPm24 TaxID=631128 RepID=UPI0020100E52|nr:replication-relaxation family protein [Frankia sp. AgPm24]MCK9921218.1 replication-relaxation family protein [Frankia sp. AgPm24]
MTPPSRRGSTRSQDALLLELAGRLTARDRWLLAMLLEHQVLTRRHITRLCFDGERQTRMRLATLHHLGVVDRVHPHYRLIAAPLHYVLGTAGAAVLAAERGITVRDLGYRRDRLHALAHGVRLAHLVEVNTLFAALVHASRVRPADQGLVAWWSERRAADTWGQIVRPDGYGVWVDGRRRLDVMVELDRGTEPLTRVLAKLPAYSRLAERSGIVTPLLIWLPSARREANLRAALRTAPPGVTILTAAPGPATAPDADDDLAPARPVWLPLHAQSRTDLDGLTRRYGTPLHPTRPLHPTDDDPDAAPIPRPPVLHRGQ